MTDARLLTVPEVAEKLGLSVHQVYRRVQRGDIATAGEFFQYLIRPEAIEKYVENGKPLSKTRRTRDPEYMSTPEAAMTLGLTVDAVRKLCFEGKLKFTRGPGRNAHLRIVRSSVEAFRRHQLNSEGLK